MTGAPDSYIERHWLDEPPSMNPCEDNVCEHVTHCDGCGRGLPAYTETGFCLVCEWEWAAKFQLPYLTSK